MRVVFLFISIFLFHSKCSSIPAYLKCVDLACNDNVSTARTLDSMSSIAGELKSLKKSIKVNIKGKNVDNNDVFWLVELEGSIGLFNSTLLKENINEKKVILKVVANPFYVLPSKTMLDETEVVDDSVLKTSSKDISKSNVHYTQDETEDIESVNYEEKDLKTEEKILDKAAPNILDKETNILTEKKNVPDKKTNVSNDNTNILNKIENQTNLKNDEKVTISPSSDADIKILKNVTINVKRTTEENQHENKGENKNHKHESPSTNSSLVDKKIKLNEKLEKVSDKNLSLQKSKSISSIEDKEVNLSENGPILSKQDVSRNTSDEIVRSPLLIFILKIEKLLIPISQSLIQKTGMDSCSFLVTSVNTWLFMSLENFVIIMLLLLSLLIVSYTPKIFRFSRDYKYEFKKQCQLILELESKLRVTEEVRQKLIVQNINFEKVINEYKDNARNIQDDATRKIRDLMVDLDRMKNNSENKVHKLSLDLAKSEQRCQLLENDGLEKDSVIENLNVTKKKMEIEFAEERFIMEEKEKNLNTKLLVVNELREQLMEIRREKSELESEMVKKSEMLNDANIKFNKLHSCFEHFKMFEELEDNERYKKVEECLQSRDIRQRLQEMELEVAHMSQELKLRNQEKLDLEEKDRFLEQRTLEYEQERSEAVKAKTSAENKLQVMTEYFQKKEVEIQKSLGHESLENSQSNDQTNISQTRINTLESENEILSKTVQKLKIEVKDMSNLASKCRNEANTKLADAFLQISNLDRELAREKDESRKLRCKLSNYLGPTTATTRTNIPNNVKDLSSPPSSIIEPPRFPLESLPKYSFSGRSSANSMSKRSNNS